jgi:serine phosphatase RsbU (regulator of sigma subunit)
MQRLLDDFALTFDLSYRLGDRTLEERIRSLIERIETGFSPEWGTSGDKKEVLNYESSELKFYYLPHLFPGMDQKLRLAHKLQFGLLPTELPEDSFVSLSALMESYCHLSGDLFGWEGLPNGDFFLWLFDVSGHGVQSGTASAVIKTLIDAEPERNDPAVLLANLNETLCSCLRSHVSSLFATAIFLRIRRDGTALYGSAGHQPFLVGLERVIEFLGGEFETPGELTDALLKRLSDYANLDYLSDDIAFVAGELAG